LKPPRDLGLIVLSLLLSHAWARADDPAPGGIAQNSSYQTTHRAGL